VTKENVDSVDKFMQLVADEIKTEYHLYIQKNPGEKDVFDEPIIEGLSG